MKLILSHFQQQMFSRKAIGLGSTFRAVTFLALTQTQIQENRPEKAEGKSKPIIQYYIMRPTAAALSFQFFQKTEKFLI